MSILGGIFRSKECSSVIEFLEKLDKSWNGLSFYSLKEKIVKYLLDNQVEVKDAFRIGNSAEKIVYLMLSNFSQAEICSTRYHIYRGALNGMGHDLLRIFNLSLDALVKIDAMTADECTKQKQQLLDEIKRWG